MKKDLIAHISFYEHKYFKEAVTYKCVVGLFTISSSWEEEQVSINTYVSRIYKEKLNEYLDFVLIDTKRIDTYTSILTLKSNEHTCIITFMPNYL